MPVKANINLNSQKMKELKEAREKRASLLKKCEELHNQASTEKRDMNAEETKQFDALWAEASAAKENIERLEKLSEIRSEKSQPANQEDPKGMTIEERAAKESKVFRKVLLRGVEKLSDEERAIHSQMEKRASTDPQSSTTTTGGYLIPTILEDALVKALKLFGGARQAGVVFQTDGGYPLDFATIDDTSNKGRLLTENTQVTVNQLVFGKKTFYAYKFSSDMVLLPTELLQDEKVDINAYLADLFGERIGRIENDYFTTGTGSSQPEGCLGGASASGVTSVSASAITKANLIDLIYSVDPLYRQSSKAYLMFNDSTAKALFKLSLGTAIDVPLFSGPFTGATNSEGMVDKILGYKYIINQSMPNIGAGLKSVVFGDFSRFKIRDVAGFRMLRLTERYADYDQIGVILLHRADSRVLTSGAIKYLLHSNT